MLFGLFSVFFANKAYLLYFIETIFICTYIFIIFLCRLRKKKDFHRNNHHINRACCICNGKYKIPVVIILKFAEAFDHNAHLFTTLNDRNPPGKRGCKNIIIY